MKKRLLALFAACTMITTAVAGMVQTAYAAEPGVRIEVADGASDTQKVLTFYYDVADGVEGVNTIQGNLTFNNDAVTIDSIAVTITNDNNQINKDTGLVSFTAFDGTSSADGSFATVNITVPGDVDVTASYALVVFEDTEYDDYAADIGTVSVTIPKKSSEPETPATVDASVEEAKAYVNKNDETDCAVVGKINLTVDGSINLADATYGGNKAQAITDMNDQALADTVITDADIILFVVINGTTDVAELSNVVFE